MSVARIFQAALLAAAGQLPSTHGMAAEAGTPMKPASEYLDEGTFIADKIASQQSAIRASAFARLKRNFPTISLPRVELGKDRSARNSEALLNGLIGGTLRATAKGSVFREDWANQTLFLDLDWSQGGSFYAKNQNDFTYYFLENANTETTYGTDTSPVDVQQIEWNCNDRDRIISVKDKRTTENETRTKEATDITRSATVKVSTQASTNLFGFFKGKTTISISETLQKKFHEESEARNRAESIRSVESDVTIPPNSSTDIGFIMITRPKRVKVTGKIVLDTPILAFIAASSAPVAPFQPAYFYILRNYPRNVNSSFQIGSWSDFVPPEERAADAQFLITYPELSINNKGGAPNRYPTREACMKAYDASRFAPVMPAKIFQ